MRRSLLVPSEPVFSFTMPYAQVVVKHISPDWRKGFQFDERLFTMYHANQERQTRRTALAGEGRALP